MRTDTLQSWLGQTLRSQGLELIVACTLLVPITLLTPNNAGACQCAHFHMDGTGAGWRAHVAERFEGLVDVASINVGVHRKLEQLARRQRGDSCALKVAVDVRSVLPQKVQGARVVQVH